MLLSGNLQSVQHIGIPCKDIELMKEWYKEVLGFEIVHEKVIGNNEENTKVTFLKLGDIIIETYESSTPVARTKKHGRIDHFAINTVDIDAAYSECISKDVWIENENETKNKQIKSDLFGDGAKYFDILSPNGERIELNQLMVSKKSIEKSKFSGWAHLGITTDNLEASIRFYSDLGFKSIFSKRVDDSGHEIKKVIIEKDGFMIELYQQKTEVIDVRDDGFIDHIALNVKDIKKAYAEIKDAGIEIIETGPTFLPFWENGVMFFTIRGPGMEKVEFSQKL